MATLSIKNLHNHPKKEGVLFPLKEMATLSIKNLHNHPKKEGV